MVWQLFHMVWPWYAPCEKARLPGWLAWQVGWLAWLAAWWQGWLAWLAGWAGLAGLQAWPGRAGWLDGQKVYPRCHPHFHHG